jgi:transposase InsO family protein
MHRKVVAELEIEDHLRDSVPCDEGGAVFTVAALHMAATTRGGDARGVIFHTDRGSEYASRRFRRACHRLGVFQSMGRVGSCFDNAVSEAFNSVLKVEYVHRHTFPTHAAARINNATWITDFYNTRRLHSACHWKSPIDYEHDYRARQFRLDQWADQRKMPAMWSPAR